MPLLSFFNEGDDEMVKVTKLLVPEHLAWKVAFGRSNSKKYIVVHQTANTSAGADARAHARLQHRGNPRAASWHETVDDKGVYQSFTHDWQLFHAGDGRYGKGNAQGIAIELCVNRDGDYQRMLIHAINRIKELMVQYQIPLSRVISHYDCSKKWCPRELLDGHHGLSFEKFKQKLIQTEPAQAKEPERQTTYVGKRVESIYSGKLRFYNKPSWKDQDVFGFLRKGEGFNRIIKKVAVSTAFQYQVSNGKAIYYVTASPKYVKVV